MSVSHSNVLAGLRQHAQKVGQEANKVFRPTLTQPFLATYNSRKAVFKADERFKYVAGCLAPLTCFDVESVENFLCCDESFRQIDDFFSGRSERAVVIFYFQKHLHEYASMPDGRRIFIANPSVDVLSGVCIAMMRSQLDEFHRIGGATINQEVTWTTLDVSFSTSLLSAVSDTVSAFMVPALLTTEDWGKLSRLGAEEFVQQLDEFAHILTSAETSRRAKSILPVTQNDDLIEQLKSPAECQRLASNNEMVADIELIIDAWMQQIERLLNESHQMRRESDDAGPSAEVIYWKGRWSRFANLAEEMKTPHCQAVICFLQMAKSRRFATFRKVEVQLNAAVNEARDNVRYLQTLDSFLNNVSQSSPQQMIEHLPGLMNAIAMIYSVSQFYNTSDHITALFIKITNEMVKMCRNFIMSGEASFWRIDRHDLLLRADECALLNLRYQEAFQRTKQRLQETNSNDRQFDFSQHYVFGKFDVFCTRLSNLLTLQNTIYNYTALDAVKLEGLEMVVGRFKRMVEALQQKNYDFFDIRQTEFDADFGEFQNHVDAVNKQVQKHVDQWFEKPLQVEMFVELLAKFESLQGIHVDVSAMYSRVLSTFEKEIERVKHTYMEHRNNPPEGRNMPPIASKIAWSRQLYYSLEAPMAAMKKRKAFASVPEAKRIIASYNKVVAVLVEYELLYHKSWCSAVDTILLGLTSTVLVQRPESSQLYVNFDPKVWALLDESRFLKKFGLEIPHSAEILLEKTPKLKQNKLELDEIIRHYEKITARVPLVLTQMLPVIRLKFEKQIEPGLLTVTWRSVGIEDFIKTCHSALDEFATLVTVLSDLIKSRIDDRLRTIAETVLIEMPLYHEDPVRIADFVQRTEERAVKLIQEFATITRLVEAAILDMLDTLQSLRGRKARKASARAQSLMVVGGFPCTNNANAKALLAAREYTNSTSVAHVAPPLVESEPPKPRANQRCGECDNCIYMSIVSQLTQQKTDALLRFAATALDTLRKRLQSQQDYFGKKKIIELTPVFYADLTLTMPSIVVKPSLEELQQSVSRIIQAILKVPQSVPLWNHQIQQILSMLNKETIEGDPAALELVMQVYQKQVSEQKDIMRQMTALSTVMLIIKPEIENVIRTFDVHSDLWREEPSTGVAQFEKTQPSYSEYESIIKLYHVRENDLDDLKPSFQVGPLMLLTEDLKLGLKQEARLWRIAFGKSLNARAAQQISELNTFYSMTNIKLSRPITDLQDVRSAMTALADVRDIETRVAMTVRPIEEVYAVLNKMEIGFSDNGIAEKVDSLQWGWKKIQALSKDVTVHIYTIQGTFKQQLIENIKQFTVQLERVVQRYDTEGPMRPGISPTEASALVASFQTDLDDLWAKYQSYSAGEVLFGLPPATYPDLYRIRRDLSLLQKLYHLYNQVVELIRYYYDMPWLELNTDRIAMELYDYQGKCRKLPKQVKEWKAYEELAKMINDFVETCPLMEMMSNKAMQPRHWERIEVLTGFKFNVQSASFSLRDLLKAPLLKHREDIEDICTAAIKERDIEAKLKAIASEWSDRTFKFAPFKLKGELLLKGDAVQEIVTAIEDSLMSLSSLMSNRYNTPFKAKIQEWINKLSQTVDMLDKWTYVQNLWIYLEAVFVGGDIAKQMPAEAKRFAGIDKSWQNIMRHAHDTPQVVLCCTSDDTLNQMLPHIGEQLEISQKCLSGYLEKKRLMFPRFFFISDPQLLEILGQSSDSHTIQAHLLSLFDNTKRLKFDEHQYDRIYGIISSEGEMIRLVTPVYAQGNVESWLFDLLRESRRSVNAAVKAAYLTIQEQASFNLIQFENSFPAQVGVLGIQMIWTRDSEEALYGAKLDRKSMDDANQKFGDILNQLIDVTIDELTKYQRVKFETLITIHVHQRDIFDDLVKNHVRSIHDFEWLKQSRFYYRYEENRCVVSITNVDFQYMNEYLGCTERLVITPLTDRCYITLAQALGMSLGGSPTGPAGTGKTETTKDMGRCLGKFVVVFNCSDQMDYRGLGRIYKGLAQSGSWGCFDEFNRIELSVLSVAAQQIATVLICKREKRSQFVFTDGDIIDLDPEFGLFLTMNPGYAGRQELPENLKINFRTCAMMVPDRAIIMRVKLASAGFQQNVMLSKKFYTLYKLCEEQLSKQVHYDFGLRNILSVLRTLGTVKRSNSNDSEPSIVMRVLRDMNLSKLVDEDESLFISLIEDLFPGMALVKAAYTEIEVAIGNRIVEAKLINHPPWTLKLIQLYETQKVRHGCMALGPTGAGKSKAITILLRAMTDCGAPHKEWRMNPKAVTAPQMFGRLDVATNDWTDGIFSTLWRKSLKIKRSENVWVILDGPVDAIWIENLNSVLDDNKTLTLANGDRIPMAPNCKLVFEVDAIDNASPATVSRMGMVYMSNSQLDWRPILKAWTLNRPLNQQKVILTTFENCFAELLKMSSQQLTPKMKVPDCVYVRQATDILDGLLDPFEQRELRDSHIQRLVIFAIMWSIGAFLELPDRLKLEEGWRASGRGLPLPLQKEETTIFDYKVSDLGDWVHWSKSVPDYAYPRDPKEPAPDYASILIPNIDNVRTEFLITLITRQTKAVLLIGEQGTAKTVIMKSFGAKYNPEQHSFKTFNFSSATTPLTVQQTIESYVDKRVGSTYGPPSGKKLTIFIDDLNMPVVNEWGDQVTNEITRQIMETGGFYNLTKPGEFTNLVDIQLVAAMPHPGGGRNDIPHRLKRQFNIFNCTLPSNASIDKIFGTLAAGHFCAERYFKDEVIDIVAKIVSITRRIWQKVKARMLPTPAKFHYVFNLRDLSRIWQGMLLATAEVIATPAIVLGLWKHELFRVIADRFTTQAEKDWFDKLIRTTVEEDLGPDVVPIIPADPIFADFLRDAPDTTGDENLEDLDAPEMPKIYEMVTSMIELRERLHGFMNQYNETVRGAAMDMVFFKDAVTNLLKISRIIRTARGNALLVGVGGSGKQSLTRLATFIAGYKMFQISITRSYGIPNLLEDLKYLFRVAGMDGKGVTFLFTDNEIQDESFLEYLNNVLASGEVSNLFTRDEIDEMTGLLVPAMKKAYPRRPSTPENLYDFFLSRVRNNLHVVLCFSPVGEKFRSRALKFPSLISGSVINWFQRWPKDALQAVSKHFLSDFEMACTLKVKQAVMNVMGDFQDIVAEMSTLYFERFRRQTSVTPKSYLSFINGYKTIYVQKREEIGQSSARMTSGLKKLVEAAQSVNDLSKQLVQKEKDLAAASAEADLVLADVTASRKAAEYVKKQVQLVKDKAQSLYDIIMADKKVAERKLEAAKPALAEAEAALQTIKPTHIATVRKLGKPPHLIMRIMDCCLLLFRRHLDPIQLDPERPCPKPSWGEALRLMGGNFLQGLLNFPKDTINDEIVELMLPYFEMEDYNMDTAKRVCGDVAGLCSWTTAMSVFFSINKEVLPLKANLAIQEARLAEAEKRLKIAQSHLDDKQRELDAVMAMYNNALAKKQNLIEDAEACRRKMNNAMLLINGLAGEKVRWTEACRGFESEITRLVGDVLLATGFLSFAGPFNQEFRAQLIKKWKKEMSNQKIPFTEDLKIIEMLVNVQTMSEWNLQGLPNDELSMQNGLIVTNSTRYPLLIDPQGQGKAWLKNREVGRDMQLTTLNHKYFRNHLEDSLSFGRPLLIEDIGEELDPVLDNVLEKNFVRFGGKLRIKLGDKEIDIANGFRLYLTTKLSNPVYRPEIAARTAIIDFTVTTRGLEDQLLSIVIATEKAELEKSKKELAEEVVANNKKMKELEDNLLYRLTSTEGSLVDDDQLIEVLNTTKATAEEVKEKLRIARETEIQIMTAREEFRPVAARGSTLYFLIVETATINCMYQTSLKQFLGIFENSMAKSARSPYTNKRIQNIIDYLTYDVFKYTCRGLYERDKFMFSLQMAVKVQLQQDIIHPEEFQIFIKGGAALDLNAVEQKPKRWITDMTWLNLVALSQLVTFCNITRQVGDNDRAWRTWFDNEAPEDTPIPDGYSSLSSWHKLLLVRSWCPDRTAPMARRFIAEALGSAFTEVVVLQWDGLWYESVNTVPLVALLSTGSDPTEDIERLGKKFGIKTGAISMGQGQEVHARRLLQQSMTEGRFMLLQNCHLSLPFMDELFETLNESHQTMHEEFRCWITTEPHPKFPINLLQMSIKFTNEPPEGVRAGLKRTYASLTQELLDYTNAYQWKPMLYAVAFLHTAVQERRKFGPIGWNIPYEFNQADFTSTVQFLQNHFDEMDPKKGVSWATVSYMIGEVQYGGRVTDDYDKRLLNTFARVWFRDAMFTEGFEFGRGYYIPKVGKLEEFRRSIELMAAIDSPECFGLHPNADITFQTNTANQMLSTILSIQPKDSGSGLSETREASVYRVADDMLGKIVLLDYKPHEVKERLRKMGSSQPLNIFLKQEITRMQRVLTTVRSTLNDLRLAIDGTIIMNETLKDALDALYDAQIPDSWKRISWESTTLGFWFTDLLDRNTQFSSWINNQRPDCFWLTGFFNPQGFLTAMRQEIARAHKGWALDAVVLANEVTKMIKDDVSMSPSEGVYVYGLYLEGAGWDRRNIRLTDSNPKVLHTMMPVIWIYAVNATEIKTKPQNVYDCPVYKKPRRTDLTYICPLQLRTLKDPDHWTLRGVALLHSWFDDDED